VPSIAPDTTIKAPNRLFPDADELLQSPFLRPRTPLEEAIAAANWSSTPTHASSPVRTQSMPPKLSRPDSWVMDDSVMSELSAFKVSESAKMMGRSHSPTIPSARTIRPASPHRAPSPMYQNHHDHGRAPYKSPVLGHASSHGNTPTASPRMHSTNYYSGSPKLNQSSVPGSPRTGKPSYQGSPKMGQIRSKSPFLNNAPNMSHLSTDHYSSEYSETESMDDGHRKHREKGKIPDKIDLELCKGIPFLLTYDRHFCLVTFSAFTQICPFV
jgi:hypothetical protein